MQLVGLGKFNVITTLERARNKIGIEEDEEKKIIAGIMSTRM